MSELTVLKKSTKAAEQDRTDVAELRLSWQECQASVDAERLVFLDETGLKTDMNRLHGWAAVGQRLVDRAAAGKWTTNALVHSVALDGTRAATVLDGPADSQCFAGFCEPFLAPSLRSRDPVLLHNLSSH